MTNFNELSNGQKVNLVNEICGIYGISEKSLNLLINQTDVKGVQFIHIADYKSDKSGQTETASQTVNVGASYQNMLTKDSVTFANLDLKNVNVEDDKHYRGIDLNGVEINDFKALVLAALPIALFELQTPKTSFKADNDIHFNKVLIYNTNTQKLSVRGQSVNKTVSVHGDFKIVKSAPKTVAKQIITKFVNSRAASLRRFNLDNVNSISISGNTLNFF